MWKDSVCDSLQSFTVKHVMCHKMFLGNAG